MNKITKKLNYLDIIKNIEKKFAKTNLPIIKVGDNIKIKIEIQEGNKTRVQTIEGIVISKHNSQLNTTITIRKIVQNIGVERVYLIHSPLIIKIEIMNHSRIRRSKLYYLRNLSGKSMKLKKKL